MSTTSNAITAATVVPTTAYVPMARFTAHLALRPPNYVDQLAPAIIAFDAAGVTIDIAHPAYVELLRRFRRERPPGCRRSRQELRRAQVQQRLSGMVAETTIELEKPIMEMVDDEFGTSAMSAVSPITGDSTAPTGAVSTTSEFPSVNVQLRNIAQAIRRLATHTLRHGELPLASPELRASRLVTCNACPQLGRNRRCIACGCFVDTKIQYTTEACPQARWPTPAE